MLISEIEDKELRELAELRRDKYSQNANSLGGAFVWARTPEDHQFWKDVNEGIRTTIK